MNKKVWYSIIVIGVVASLAIGGTYAYFTATRTTSANKFTAGTLDLNVAASTGELTPFVIENMGEGTNISGTKTWTIKNTGSLPGRLLLNLQNVVNSENGCNDQEKIADPTCDATGKEGDLGKVVNLKIKLGDADKVNSTLAADQQAKIGTDWAALEPIILQPSEQKTVTAYWTTDESSYGNEIQSDAVQFDINFRLIQLIK